MKNRLFKDILPRVSKPVRYAGGEVNMIRKDWDKAGIKMAIAFPDVYEIGMSHIGSKILYGVVNEKSHHLMERTFAPWPDMEDLMRQEGIPLYSLESFIPINRFDVVGFSLQYELSITNVLNMLDLSSISVLSKDRGENEPIVVAGGPVAFNPEPFADFFDAFMIGDGEDVILELLDALEASKGRKRQERLLDLAKIEGVYVPSFYQVEYNEDGTFHSIQPTVAGAPGRIRKRLVTDLEEAYYPEKPILPYMEIVHDRAVLEVMRGCQRGCRFCHAGIVYRPVRERSVALLEKQAEQQLKNTGYDEISLASLSTLDYSGVDQLVKNLVCTYGDRGVGVSLPSLRVDAFSIDLANEVQKVRKTTLTLAPEAGTQRMRDVINKNVDEEQLYQAVEAAFKSGWKSVKLYFMFGLPTETLEDLDGILSLVDEVRKIGNRYSRRPIEVRGSLACFVPKAHTPFQWEPQDSTEQLEEKRHHMMSRKMKNVKLSFHDSSTSSLEGAIARGDRRIGPVIYQAWKNGCKFDGWSEYFHMDGWMEAFSSCGIDISFYTQRQRPFDEVFPWDFVETGVTKEYLQRENEKAREPICTPDCRQEGCLGCGVCQAFETDLMIKE